LTFDLEEWPWRWHVTTQKVRLYKIHVNTKYQMSISIGPKLWPMLKWMLWPIFWPLTLRDDLDLNILPIKMCSFMKYTCMPNIKSLCVIGRKLWPMLKLSPKTCELLCLTLKQHNVLMSHYPFTKNSLY